MSTQIAPVAVYAAIIASTATGIYGVMTSKTLIRLLVSIELFFNSIVLSAAYIGYTLGVDPGFYSLLIAIILLTIAEMAVIVALVVLLYRRKKTLELDAMMELKG